VEPPRLIDHPSSENANTQSPPRKSISAWSDRYGKRRQLRPLLRKRDGRRSSEQTDHVRHCALDVPAGQLYGYRVHRPYEPLHGHRFNGSKLLPDPYAKAITGPINWEGELFGYPLGSGDDADLRCDDRDSAALMPKCVVVDDAFDWGNDKHPGTLLAESIFTGCMSRDSQELSSATAPACL